MMNSGWKWIGLVLGLLGLNLSVAGVLIFAATGDESFAVDPAYHREETDANARAHQKWINQQLGWSVVVAEMPSEQGRLIVEVRDRAGQSVSGAEMTATAYHKADPKTEQVCIFEWLEDGHYACRIEGFRQGVWGFAFQVRHGGALFTSEQSLELHGVAAETGRGR